MATRPDEIEGGILRPNAGIQLEYSKAIMILVRRMCDETKAEVKSIFAGWAADGAAMDENISVQARIRMNRLSERYQALFDRAAKRSTKRMIERTLKNSAVTVGMSVKDFSEHLTIKAELINDRMREVIAASTTEAANLIKRIPEKYLGEVQGQVMRSITTGNGLQDLIPYLNKKYDQNIRHAKNVALDQTRKAYQSLSAAKMQAAGIRQFKWIHVGGSQSPRQDHIEMSGKIYDFDDLPVIDKKTGEKGLPGQAIFCRCQMRPVLNFGAR